MIKHLSLFAAALLLCASLSGCINPMGQASDEAGPGTGQTDATEQPVETQDLETPAPPAETETPAPDEEEKTPFDVDSVDLEGNAVNTVEFAKEHDLTLVNMWATWCGPCISEMPSLQALYEEYSADGSEYDVAFLGVWLDPENRGDLEAVLEYTGAAYPMIVFQNEMASLVDLMYIPATVFLDGEGNIVGEPVVGAKSESAWRAEIEARLKAAGVAAYSEPT